MPKNGSKTSKKTTATSRPVPHKPAAASPPVKKAKPKGTGSAAGTTTVTVQRSSVAAKSAAAVAVKTPPTPSKTTTDRVVSAAAAGPTVAKLVSAKPAAARSAATDVLAKAEADIITAIDSLNTQMNSAIITLTELAVTQRGEGEAVMRTLPLDRATTTFQRLVGEVVDDQLGEMLPTLVALRGEMAQRARHAGPADTADDDFFHRGAEMLDHVLTAAGVNRFEVRPGAPFDPLIHLAVGETNRNDLADGAVAEAIQPGYRTARGKVIAPARVKVNRR